MRGCVLCACVYIFIQHKTGQSDISLLCMARCMAEGSKPAFVQHWCCWLLLMIHDDVVVHRFNDKLVRTRTLRTEKVCMYILCCGATATDGD